MDIEILCSSVDISSTIRSSKNGNYSLTQVSIYGLEEIEDLTNIVYNFTNKIDIQKVYSESDIILEYDTERLLEHISDDDKINSLSIDIVDKVIKENSFEDLASYYSESEIQQFIRSYQIDRI